MAYSSIDLEGFAQLVHRLTVVSDVLQTVAADLRGKAAAESVSTTATWSIGNVGAWAQAELPSLRRRLELARVADAARPASLRGTTVRLSEPVVSAAEAQARGRELAELLNSVTSTDEEGARQLHELADELAAWTQDPDAMAAFWAAAGPQWAETMASYLAATGSDTAAADLAVFSAAFSTALHDTDPPPEFTQIVELFTTAPADGPAGGWDRLALLQHGTPPTDLLVEIVQVNALDFFDADQIGRYDPRNLPGERALGLPGDAYALAFLALSRDPEAVRAAVPASGVPEMLDLVIGYQGAVGSGDQVADAFGRALASGAGVGDETSGAHSDAAARFTLALMTATAGYDEVPWVMKDSFAEIAASYAPELLAGSNLGDATFRESGMTRPEGWTAFEGLDPAFYLSSADTYGFLRSFGDTDAMSTPFDEAAGKLFEQLLGAAAEYDAETTSTEMFRTAKLFGNLAGLQYLAQKEERQEADEFDQAVRDALGKVFSFGLGKVPTPQGQLAGYAWKAAKWGINKAAAEWRAGDPSATRVALLDDATVQAAFLRDYQMYAILATSVPEHMAKLPDVLQGPDGLIPAEEIAADADLIDEFARWLDTQDADFTEGTTDRLVEMASTGFSGGFQKAQDVHGET